MPGVTKIAISLSAELLAAVEVYRKNNGESRSEFFRRAAEKLMRQERERGAVEEYIRGYVQQPEGKDEHALIAPSHHLEILEYEEQGQGAG